MSKKWEINRVSTSEHIFNGINSEMAQPVGIVLFGADCGLKDDVFRECVEQIPNLATPGHDGSSHSVVFEMTERGYFGGRNVLMVMSGESSGDHEQRHQVVTNLRNNGLKSVVGIYVKPRLLVLKVARNAKHLKDARWIEQAEAIEQNPPTADGLDYLFIVSEEKEG